MVMKMVSVKRGAPPVEVLYVEMAERCRDLMVELMMALREGRYGLMFVCAQRLRAQAGALEELLEKRKEDQV